VDTALLEGIGSEFGIFVSSGRIRGAEQNLEKVKCFLYTRWDVNVSSLLTVLYQGSVRDKA